MPSSTPALRAKFMECGPGHCHDDGIAKAEKFITDAGGVIRQGVITIDTTSLSNDVYDAIEFLCDEWDYALEPRSNQPS